MASATTDVPFAWKRVLLLILALACASQAFFTLTTQKSLGWDAAMGFLTLQSSLEHGEFNHLRHPVAENLARDRSDFVAWWTPGQYLVPHWVARLLQIDAGRALRIVAALCCLGGLLGYYLLYTRLGFSPVTVCLSVIVISCQPYFLRNIQVYSGGDLLLFAAAPYLSLLVLQPRRSVPARAAVAAVACLGAMFLKASALTVFLALLLCLALESWSWPALPTPMPVKRSGLRPWRHSILLLLVLGAFVVIAHHLFLSRGVTIGATAKPWGANSLARGRDIVAAIGGPLTGAFAVLEGPASLARQSALAAISGLAVWHLARNAGNVCSPAYRRLLVAFYAGFTLFFSYAYSRGMGISAEARHFRLVGLLLIPGLVQLLMSLRPRVAIGATLVALSVASAAHFYHAFAATAAAPDSASRWGIRQPISNASLEAMHRAAAALVGEHTVVFSGFGACPSLLLEFDRGRRMQDNSIIHLGYTGRTAAPVRRYGGSAVSIVILVPKNNPWYFGESLAEIARTFERPMQVSPWFENEEMTIYHGSVR